MSDWLDYTAIDFKIKSIHKDIIRLKQENRNIGDKIKSLYCNISTNALKLIDCSETAGYTYTIV